jgi:hypothetical protein
LVVVVVAAAVCSKIVEVASAREEVVWADVGTWMDREQGQGGQKWRSPAE